MIATAFCWNLHGLGGVSGRGARCRLWQVRGVLLSSPLSGLPSPQSRVPRTTRNVNRHAMTCHLIVVRQHDEELQRAMKKIILSLFLVPLSSLADEPASTAKSRPYYDCMKFETSKYSKKTDQVNDAILAASDSCSEERKKLMGHIIAELIYTEGMPGNEAVKVAEIAVGHIDARMRPSLIKAALDSR